MDSFHLLPKKEFVLRPVVLSLIIFGLYITSLFNYLLFHSLTEIFSIVVAFSLFMIAWNSKQYIKNPFLLFLGIAYLFIGFIDLLHTLSYKGMSIFTDYDYYANQLWIAARFMESLSILTGFIFLKKETNFNPILCLFIYSIVTAFCIASIFVWKVFPICFIEGYGLTPFKIYSEYIICLTQVASIFLLTRFKQKFEASVYSFLMISMIFTVISELAFTVYVNNYGFSNLVGHFFKLFSFMYIYKAIVQTGIEDPYKVIFRDLDNTNLALNKAISIHKQTERDKQQLIQKLTLALEEIKTLKGILPICMHCKKIRDDQGYWNQIETYIKERSEAEFSHSICPDCLKTHYPDVDMSDSDRKKAP